MIAQVKEYADNVVHMSAFFDSCRRRSVGRECHQIEAKDFEAKVLEMPGFRTGDWVVYPLAGDIFRNGKIQHLEPKVMDALVLLTDRAGQVISRSELLERLWGARSVFSDECLTRCVSALRKAFGDLARDPKYIRTVPKRGYRFLQAVHPLRASN